MHSKMCSECQHLWTIVLCIIDVAPFCSKKSPNGCFAALNVFGSHRRCSLHKFKDLFAVYFPNYCTDIKINSLLQWEHKSSSCDVEKLQCIVKLNARSESFIVAASLYVQQHNKMWAYVVRWKYHAYCDTQTHTRPKQMPLMPVTTQSVPYLPKHSKQLGDFDALKPSSGPLFLPSHHSHFPSLCYFFLSEQLQLWKKGQDEASLRWRRCEN